MKRIIGIGNALVDVMTRIDNEGILDKFSLPKGSMTLVDSVKSKEIKIGTRGFERTLASGGSAANTIHGIAMLGPDPGFIGSVGKDDTGDFFEKDMKDAGVKTLLFRRQSVTGTAVALVSPDSERTFATHLGAAVELNADDLSSEQFRDYNILYLEGYLIINKALVEKACILARNNDMEIAIDLASYNVVKANLNEFRHIIENYCTMVFANEDEAKAFTGCEPEEALAIIAGMCDISIVKKGKDGSLIKRGEELIKVNSLPVKSIDTTGAGDLYAAGFLYGYSKGLPLDVCGAAGSLLAGNVIENIGARIDNKKWPEIKKRLNFLIQE